MDGEWEIWIECKIAYFGGQDGVGAKDCGVGLEMGVTITITNYVQSQISISEEIWKYRFYTC